MGLGILDSSTLGTVVAEAEAEYCLHTQQYMDKHFTCQVGAKIKDMQDKLIPGRLKSRCGYQFTTVEDTWRHFRVDHQRVD